MVDVKLEGTELRLSTACASTEVTCDEEVRVADKVRQITGLNRPVRIIQLASSESCEHAGKVDVNSIEEIVRARSVARPVVVTVRQYRAYTRYCGWKDHHYSKT
jgi:hypothetical protein